MRAFWLFFLFAVLAPLPALEAQTRADSAAIRGAALDYIEGWYDGDAARMERALHPKLAKRIVMRPPNGADVLREMSAAELIQATAGRPKAPEDRRRREVRILDVYNGIASVRVVAQDWVDHLHLARSDGRWRIVNVLWERHPR